MYYFLTAILGDVQKAVLDIVYILRCKDKGNLSRIQNFSCFFKDS